MENDNCPKCGMEPQCPGPTSDGWQCKTRTSWTGVLTQSPACAEIARLRALNREMLEVLHQCVYSDTSYGEYGVACGLCGTETKHKPDCELDAIIKKAEALCGLDAMLKKERKAKP